MVLVSSDSGIPVFIEMIFKFEQATEKNQIENSTANCLVLILAVEGAISPLRNLLIGCFRLADRR